MDETQNPAWMELKEWKERFCETHGEEDTAGDQFALQKAASGHPVLQDDNDRTIQFVVSTAHKDRDGDQFDTAGWNVENFLKNPVVPFAHDYKSLPVAKAVKLEVDHSTNSLISVAKFVEKEIHPFADTVYQMVKGGYLNAVSVGFRPLRYLPTTKGRGSNSGFHFLEQELLEFSVVPVPANAQTLVAAKSVGIPVQPFVDWCRKAIDEYDSQAEEENNPPRLPRPLLEDLVKSQSSVKVLVDTTLNKIPESFEGKMYHYHGRLPGSYEKMAEELKKLLPAYLMASEEVDFEPENYRCEILGTFNDYAVFCVGRYTQPHEKWKCFKAYYATDSTTGDPMWKKKPVMVDIKVTTEVVAKRKRALEAELKVWSEAGQQEDTPKTNSVEDIRSMLAEQQKSIDQLMHRRGDEQFFEVDEDLFGEVNVKNAVKQAMPALREATKGTVEQALNGLKGRA